MKNAPQPKIELNILGPYQLMGPAGAIRINNRKLAGLLAYLAYTAPNAQSREKLTALLWGSHFEEQARQNLRQTLTRLRRIVGQDAVVTHENSLTVNTSILVCDTSRFIQLASEGGSESLSKAIKLYRGMFLSDVSIQEEQWIEWVDLERRRFEEHAVDIMIKSGQQELGSNRISTAERLGRRAVEINRFREDGHRLIMRALAGRGRKADALRHFEDLAQFLKKELETDPDSETLKLERDLRQAREIHNDSSWSDSTRLGSVSTKPPAVTMAIRVQGSRRSALNEIRLLLPATSREVATVASNDNEQVLAVNFSSAVDAAGAAFDLSRRSIVNGATINVGMGMHDAVAEPRARAVLPHALAELADRGRLLASQDVCEHLVDGVDATVTDLGLMQSRSHGMTLRAFELAPPPSEGCRRSWRLQARMRPVVAVLPFLDAIEESSNTLRAELLSSEINSALSLSKYVDVISHQSACLFSTVRTRSRPDFSHLQADYLIVGIFTSSREPNDIKVELIDATSQVTKWQGVRAAPLYQPEHARSLAEWIAAEALTNIVTSELERSAISPLSSMEAYSLLFSGIASMDRWTRSSFQRSGELLRQLHSGYKSHPLPNAWLSAWHIRSISQGWTEDPKRDGLIAIEHARRGLDADPNCSISLTMAGWAHVYTNHRLSAALEQFDNAIEINQSASLAWLLKGVTHAFLGQGAKASEAARRALALSPLDPRRSYYVSM